MKSTIVLLVIFLFFSSYGMAINWIQLDTLRNQYSDFIEYGNGSNQIVFLEGTPNPPGRRGFLTYSVHDLFSGNRIRERQFQRPDTGSIGQYTLAIINDREEIAIFIRQGAWYYQKFSSNDSIIQSWRVLTPFLTESNLCPPVVDSTFAPTLWNEP